ncbi:MAG: MGMT family protein [Gammaproteobacteria bacterium]|nr:MGMT family protein [Gammaproteobacteria bacterium]
MLKIDEIIWQIVASIPKGNVGTYGQIAKLAGYPNHARYVGATLKLTSARDKKGTKSLLTDQIFYHKRF